MNTDNAEKAAEFCKNFDTSCLHTWFEDENFKGMMEESKKYQEIADFVYKNRKPIKVKE